MLAIQSIVFAAMRRQPACRGSCRRRRRPARRWRGPGGSALAQLLAWLGRWQQWPAGTADSSASLGGFLRLARVGILGRSRIGRPRGGLGRGNGSRCARPHARRRSGVRRGAPGGCRCAGCVWPRAPRRRRVRRGPAWGGRFAGRCRGRSHGDQRPPWRRPQRGRLLHGAAVQRPGGGFCGFGRKGLWREPGR